MDMTPEKIYAEIGKFIPLLKSGGNDKLARILEHRMYKVSWTSSTELLENVASILTDYINDHENTSDRVAVEQAKSIIKKIEPIVRT